MACFIVPASGAVISKFIAGKAEKQGKVSFAHKLGWLTKLLAGGSVLLVFEHLWHGEIVPFAPFLTAGKTEAFAEMSTVGMAMVLFCMAVWGVMLAVCAANERQYAKDTE